MKAPAFWSREPGWQAALLGPIALLYGTVAARRMRRPGRRAGIPVICVGNFTAGGVGKTPTAIALARMLAEAGWRPAFLTRGYGGSLAGPVRVDPARHGPAETGDEALLLARHATTIVARDRPAGAALAERNGADIVVMDDGLQNPSLAKDLALGIFDGETGLGNGRVLPAGPLRAPAAAQWPKIDAAIVVGPGAAGDRIAADAGSRGLPVLRAALTPDPETAGLAGSRVLAFAGIGRPAKFFATCRAAGLAVAATRSFADHHVFTHREIADLLDEAERGGLIPVTTEKDAVRLSPLAAAEPRLSAVRTLPVTMRFGQPERLSDLLTARFGAPRDRVEIGISPTSSC